MQNKSYDAIDLLKFIACIFVVGIHSDPFVDISPLMNRLISVGIGRIAVPLFFVASAFFLFKGPKIDIKKYLARMGKLYLAWFLILLPSTIFNRFIVGDASIYVKCFQFCKSFFLTSTFSGSWFLASCVFCTSTYYFLEKYQKCTRWYIIIAALFIYVLCASTSSWGTYCASSYIGYTSLYDNFVFWFAKPYTSILVGFPYFLLGYYLAKNEAKIKAPNLFISLILIGALLGEAYITYKNGYSNSTDCYFMLLPCAYCIFVTFLQLNISIPNASTLRKYSTLVFFSQFIWLFVIEFVEWGGQLQIPQIVKFIAGLTLCMITAWSVVKLSDKYKILKYLY